MATGEKKLIAEIRRMAASAKSSAVRKGIGDDCAVLRLKPQSDLLVTTDFSLEGVHFRRDWHSPQVAGRRCLVRGLSDIAAMGGTPLAAFLSLALPRSLPPGWVARFLKSMVHLGERYGCPLAGGDTAESPSGILADIIVVGNVPRGKAVLRSGAKAGDRIFVSGLLGGAAAAVEVMRRQRKVNPREYERHFAPEPRLEVGRILREKNLASAMIDTSDGLSTDLAHICEESGTGAELRADAIPRAHVGKWRREIDLPLALHGGEDYELLFTVRPGKKIPATIAGVTVYEIGRIVRGRRIFLLDSDGKCEELKPGGWEHFAAR